jgi:hypothetical protein
MGRVFIILTIIWVVGLVICIQRGMFWKEEVEQLDIYRFSKPPDERHPTPEEVVARREADRNTVIWTTGAILWGVIGMVALLLTWRWEERRKSDDGPWTE